MKKLILLLFITASCTTFAQKQKITVDEDTIRVDGVSFAILEKKTPSAPSYTVKSMSGTPLMHWQFYDFNDPGEVSNSNTSGRVTYFQITFLGDKQQCEIRPVMANSKHVAKVIVENELIKNGAINQEAENNFVLINGMKFTEQKQRATGGNIIIINK